MTRFFALALAGMFLLLGSVANPALARPSSTGNPAPAVRPLQVAQRYFALRDVGLRTTHFSALASLYAPHARFTLSRWLARDGQPHQMGTAQGRAAIMRLYREAARAFAGYQWTPIQVHRFSGSQLVGTERVRGSAGAYSLEAETDLVIHAGKITSLSWTIYVGD